MATKLSDLPGPERRVIRAWCVYDWANSGYAASGVAAILPIYFVFLFQDALGESVNVLGLTLTGSSTWSLAIALSTTMVVLSSPVLGVIIDRVAIKKALLWTYTLVGSLATCLMFLSAYVGQPWLWFLAMFLLANVGFAGCLVFYNAFLPHIAPRHLLDDVSSRGFAYGYVGGGLLLAVHLAVILLARDSQWADLATRLAICSIGFWWFGWALWTFKVMPEPPITNQVRRIRPLPALRLAFRELAESFRHIKGYRVIAIYLVAYLLFNDGIQTVLGVAGAYGAETVGLPLVFNMATILIIQFVAAAGAMFFSWLAYRITTKWALTAALAGWALVILFGVGVVPLAPQSHQDFDYQLSYQSPAGTYVVDAAPEVTDSAVDLAWGQELESIGLVGWDGNHFEQGDTLSSLQAVALLATVESSEHAAHSISLADTPQGNVTAVGRLHPANLGDGPVDWWPDLVRRLVWQPLGLDAPYQWLLLGVGVGLVMGGSQALARSLFAQIVPHSKSGEFFSFFGFMGRVSSVFGPLLYVLVTGVLDSRVAILAILALIIAGGVMLKWVDVQEGTRVAGEVDAQESEGQASPLASAN